MADVVSEPIKGLTSLTLTDGEYKKIADFIRTNYGINIREEKRTLLIGRLGTLLAQSGYKSFAEYFESMLADRTGEALSAFVNRITTNHTFFMREPDHFYFFRDSVLPYLEKSVADRDLRIWCAACSSGEESYTLAMIVDEYFKANKRLWDCRILATDISSKVLEEARRGIYDQDKLSPLPPYWRLNYFRPCGEGKYGVTEKIKKEVIYRKFNLMEKQFPFKKKFHCIFCRNVMMYFDEQNKDELVERLYDCTEPGGYLFVGHSEALSRESTRYRYVQPAVYRKI